MTDDIKVDVTITEQPSPLEDTEDDPTDDETEDDDGADPIKEDEE